MEAVAVYRELDCGDDVKLSGWHSPQPCEAPGLVVLIHGWEGSHASDYQYSMACRLYAEGFSVFRLNLRDHGGSHHLNTDLFHAARLDEVIDAIRQAQSLDGNDKLFVLGFSLGGNFALRVALQSARAGLAPKLCIGISPAISPAKAVAALDSAPRLIQHYFRNKWKRSLEAKQAAWPQFEFGGFDDHSTFLDKHRWMVARYTDFACVDDYFAAYTLLPEELTKAPCPVAIITSKDDPVVPDASFQGMRIAGSVEEFLNPAQGGHCGFIEGFDWRTWSEECAARWLNEHC